MRRQLEVPFDICAWIEATGRREKNGRETHTIPCDAVRNDWIEKERRTSNVNVHRNGAEPDRKLQV